MPSTILQPSTPKLSICITTLNRAAFIGATLESILVQLTNDCEVVVLDAASTDGTQGVVTGYTQRFDRLRYVRQHTNNGIDRDYDRAVELAAGEYCWLMTDDDLLKPGAVAAVLEALHRDFSLVIVNAEIRSFNMSTVLQPRFLDFASNRVYGPKDMDRLAFETSAILQYIGGFVIRRVIWVARKKQPYYGSLFIHVGVIFQERLPGETLVMADPLISYRMGNAHTFSPKLFETAMVNWPSVVGSLTLSDSTKSKVYGGEPWKSFQELLYCRAMGVYSLTEYRQWISPQLRSIPERLTPALVALLPGVLVNALLVFYYFVTRRRYLGWQPELILQQLRESRFHIRNCRVFKREF